MFRFCFPLRSLFSSPRSLRFSFLSVRVPVTGEGLSGEVTLDVQYQPCTEGEGGSCFPPTNRTLKVKASEIPAATAAGISGIKPEKKPDSASLQVDAPAPEASSAPVAVPTAEAAKAPVPEAPHQGLLLALLLVFLAGMGASLTPCVYPMIPITMAIIGAKGGGKAKGFALSLMLVLGMAVTYTTLGVVAAKSGAAFGAFALLLLILILGLLLGIRAVENFLNLPLLPRGGATVAVEAGPKAWMEQDLEGALKKAKAEHKLVLVDVYAEWCAQCKELDEKTWPDAEVKAWIAKNAIAIRIDTDKQRPDLAKKLEIRSYPSVILLDGEGREVGRSLGFQKPQNMLVFLAAR